MTLTRVFLHILFVSGIVFLNSCVQKSSSEKAKETAGSDKDSVETKKPEVEDESIINNSPTVDVAVYTEYPEEIDGCACYFSKTATELKAGQYIFMTNYEKKAYMTLDGKMRVFDLIDSKDGANGKLTETWKNENYDMVVTSSETGQIDETWQKIGSISIQTKDKNATVIKVVGECGC